jgi:hypothetical protein
VTQTGTVLLVIGLVVMIALVFVLSRANRKNLARGEAEQAATLGLRPSLESDRLPFLDWLWRRTDRRRHAWGLLQGSHAGWAVRAFLFEHDSDAVVLGARALTRVFAHSFMFVTTLATDSRTARQRGVMIAAAYDGEPATFKVRGRKMIARNERARALLARSKSRRIRHWVPPARIQIREDWFFLQSFYVVPRWIGPYVRASTDICTALAASGAIQPRDAGNLPIGPLF